MLGTRKKINDKEFGDYEFKTYKEIHSEVIDFATGVSLLGLCPEMKSMQTFNLNSWEYIQEIEKNGCSLIQLLT